MIFYCKMFLENNHFIIENIFKNDTCRLLNIVFPQKKNIINSMHCTCGKIRKKNIISLTSSCLRCNRNNLCIENDIFLFSCLQDIVYLETLHKNYDLKALFQCY